MFALAIVYSRDVGHALPVDRVGRQSEQERRACGIERAAARVERPASSSLWVSAGGPPQLLRNTTPPTPPVLSVTGVTPSEVWLSWTASTDDIPLNIAGYRVLVDGAPATNVLWLSERQAAVRHLTRDTPYRFTIEARDRSGNVATSNTVATMTPASTDIEAPTVPGNLRWISEHGDCEVVLGWDQSTDNVDPQSSIRYEFYLNGVLNDLAIGVDTMLTYGFRGPELSTFTLVGVDRSGNASAPSSPLTLAISGC
jgi:Fibronectin type III domain